MRALLPVPTDEVDVHEFYARGWVDGGGLRANFISSVDGAISVDGLSRGLQTAGDNRVFAALRDLADVVLVGAGTAVAENYRPVRPGPERTAIRQRFGLAPVLPVAVVSAGLHVEPSSALFRKAPPDARTIVYTVAAAPATRLAALREHAEVVLCGETVVDLSLARTHLRNRGLTRILSEGGPMLFADLVREALVDELCLSVSPRLAGPTSAAITGARPWSAADSVKMTLDGLLEEDGALFHRYRLH